MNRIFHLKHKAQQLKENFGIYNTFSSIFFFQFYSGGINLLQIFGLSAKLKWRNIILFFGKITAKSK